MSAAQDPRDELADHLPALRAFAISLTRNASSADDLVQDTIVKAWSNIEKFQRGTNLRAWLFTIQRNAVWKTELSLLEDAAANIDRPVDNAALASQIADFLKERRNG